MDYTEINGNYIRNYLVYLLAEERNPGKVLEGRLEWKIPSGRTLNLIRTSEEFLRSYYYLLIASEWAGLVYANPKQYAPQEVAKNLTEEQLNSVEDTSIIKEVLETELRNANVLIALVAWLSVDGFDWSSIDSNIPDLSYGLVKTNPKFILPFAAFCSGLGRDKIRSSIFTVEIEDKIVEKSKELAANHTITN